MIIARPYFIFLSVLFFIIGCQDSPSNPSSSDDSSFDYRQSILEEINGTKCGLDFQNRITETPAHNFYSDQYFYNGGGVAVGDINNDNLPDVYFTGNLSNNKLFINKGNLQFEDITSSAGVLGQGWCFGANMVDVNNDGNLDIYVCRAGKLVQDIEQRRNLLYINNGDNTFTESAKKYGLDDPGYSIQSSFADFDLDGDLDMFLTNYTKDFNLTYSEMKEKSKNPSDFERNKLYINNGNGTFQERGKEMGIIDLGHSLGLGVADFNGDQYPDVYIGNDYATSDYFYLNLKGERFQDAMSNVFRHTSQFSMGLEMADVNNDCLLDILVMDMNPEDNFRQKATMPSMNPEDFWNRINFGFHPQFMRNTLQINNGNGSFSEIGQLAGIPNTDWSWSPLAADLDNDGWKDLFITNSFLREIQDKDYMKGLEKISKKQSTVNWEDASKGLKTYKKASYVFRNNRDHSFEKINDTWGVQFQSYSNGAAYADFDNDGDIDYVINNINEPATLVKNNARSVIGSNFLQIKLIGSSNNIGGIGSKITVFHGEEKQFIEFQPSRGYLSSVDHLVHFGLGGVGQIDKIEIIWPDGKTQVISNVPANQRITLEYSNAKSEGIASEGFKKIFGDAGRMVDLNVTHKENIFDDYKDQVLLPHKMSQFGPSIAVGDVDKNGLEDFYFGGASEQAGQLILQFAPMQFKPASSQPWTKEKQSEDLGAIFFDANGDQALDLYVVSGGNEFKEGSGLYQDRLYINDKTGNFTKSNNLPKITASGGSVSVADYDKDGDLDLFVGGRLTPSKYMLAPESYLLRNDGGKFTNVTKEACPELVNPGMVTSSVWMDYNKDGNIDLLIAGEWMNVMVFEGNGKTFKDQTSAAGLDNTSGWWNKLAVADIDKDGDMDLIGGNLGLNYKYRASPSEPFKVYCDDFDGNGKWDIILGYFQNGVEFPLRGRQCSSEQLPFVAEKFATYTEFGKADINEVYGDQLKTSNNAEVTMFESTYFENKNGVFIPKALPNRAQFSPIFGMEIKDFNGDGNPDILGAGNLYVSEVETGMADAGIGFLLAGDGKGNFKELDARESGLFLQNDVRDIAIVHSNGPNTLLLVANNNSKMQLFGFSKKY